MKKMIAFALAAAVAGCLCINCDTTVASAVSPDGRSEIRLHLKPLSYEVLRDGRQVVALTEIGMTVDGVALRTASLRVETGTWSGRVPSPVYKKSNVDLAGNWTFVDFGDWGVRLAARDDGVAYRFETKRAGRIRVDGEKAGFTVPDGSARCWVNFTDKFGCEETVPEAMPAKDVTTGDKKRQMVYLPFVYDAGGTTVAVTESDVFDYPIWNLTSAAGSAAFDGLFAGWPKKTDRVRESKGWKDRIVMKTGGRWVRVLEHDACLVETEGSRTFPWRTFLLADRPSQLCASDAVWALARPAAEGHDFSWVKPGKVAWDWWNCFDNCLTDTANGGCNTKTYERFIDFAAKTGVEYVIFDEGWSEKLDIWKFHPAVDVPHLIDYANKRGVGIILWMAWAQAAGDEARVASHFAKLGAKGFKVDFMDRGDAACERFLWKFAEECRKNRMLVDYHGAHRPTGMSRAYPNVLNYEGIHGLECMKWYGGKGDDFMMNDVRGFFLRMTAGPLDYTPGSMLNYPLGGTYNGAKAGKFPGSVGTRCRQMAMMALYEAPLQMLCDSPTNYEANDECFKFMAATPVVWEDTIGIGGTPDSFAAVARKARDGSWYAAAIAGADACDWTLDTSFLGAGEWKAEIFRDAPTSDAEPRKYVHESKTVKAGAAIPLHMAKGGGFVIRFVKTTATAGLLDKAWLMGVTDKDPLSYKPGEEIVFTVTPMDLGGEIPSGEYFLDWKKTDDYGQVEKGKVPLTGESFTYKTKLDKAGFVRLEVYVVDKNGHRYTKKFVGDASTPEGKKAMNAFERSKKAVFFDGGAGVDVGSLASHEEPKDFDEFWARQYKRLDLVPIKDERIEIKCSNPKARLYAVRIECAGLRPVTGYLSIPKAVDEGKTFPCRLETHGYSGDSCKHGTPSWARDNEIVLNINAHGLKLVEFGATEADTKALRWEVRSNGNAYAFDAKQNEDPEVAYFNGMVLRVKRGLQYLKTLKGWNGKDLIASGGSQGGLQTIWAAGCGEGVTRAESGITWCCDMFNNNLRREHKISSDGWYIPWTESMGYYDAVNFAKRIPKTCHTIITRAGLGDYCCPPMGLAKLWNSIPGNKQINWVQGSEHGYVPPAYKGRDITYTRD